MQSRERNIAQIKNDQAKSAIVKDKIRGLERYVQFVPASDPKQPAQVRPGKACRDRVKCIVTVNPSGDLPSTGGGREHPVSECCPTC